MRVGFGYDSHCFSDTDRPLVLGGVVIPGFPALKAHSDGDVVIHSVVDAILGAAAIGDIGMHFPDTEERWHGADSTLILSAAVDMVRKAGYRIGNLDITIVCEKPKIRPYADAMCERLAFLLGVEGRAVSIKGKTNEKMDDVGAGKGIVVYAAVLLEEL